MNGEFCRMRRWLRWCLVLLAVTCTVSASLSRPSEEQGQGITTIFLVRHAEKNTQGDDPELTDVGRARAEKLASLLGHASVTALYASEYRRTQQTLAPIAAALGLPLEVREASRHAELAKEILDRHAGEAILIASHSNVVPLLIESLGGGAVREIGEMEYDNLFIVTVSGDGSCRVTRLKF